MRTLVMLGMAISLPSFLSAADQWQYSTFFNNPNASRPKPGAFVPRSKTYSESDMYQACRADVKSTDGMHTAEAKFHYGEIWKWSNCATNPPDTQFRITYELSYSWVQKGDSDGHWGAGNTSAHSRNHGHFIISSRPAAANGSAVHDFAFEVTKPEGGQATISGGIGWQQGQGVNIGIGGTYTFSDDTYDSASKSSSGALHYFFNSGSQKWVEGRCDGSTDQVARLANPNGAANVYALANGYASLDSFDMRPN